MSSRFFFPNPNAAGDWDIGKDGILVPRDGYFSGNLRALSFNGGPLSGLRNRFRNSKATVGTRGNGVAGLTTGVGMDGWTSVGIGGGVVTQGQSTDVPAGSNLPYSIRVTVTTADAAMAVTDRYELRQAIEGFDVADCIGQTLIVGFWVRSPKTGVHSFSLVNGASDRSWVGTYTVNVANTWEWKTVTVTGGLNTAAGTWNFLNGVGVYGIWTLAAGANFASGTTGAWVAGGLVSQAGQPNCMDTVGNIFAIAGPRFERCTSLQPGYEEFVPIGVEVARNARYLQATTNPYTGAIVGGHTGTAISTTRLIADWKFHQTMRAVPTMTLLYNAGLNQMRNTGSGALVASGAPSGYSPLTIEGFSLMSWAAAVLVAGQFYDFDLLASAELA